MEKIICEISEESTPLSFNTEADLAKKSSDDDENCFESDESDDDSDNDEEEEEESQPIEEKYPPEACVGDFVTIDRVREYPEGDYRFSFTDEMFEKYSGKVLVVRAREFAGEPDDSDVHDDGYHYDLADIYGKDTGYSWASSMFSKINHEEEVPNRTLDGLSRGLIAFQRVLHNYLISPNKVGLYESKSIWAISLKYSSNERCFIAAPGDSREIFAFPNEKSAIDFYKANRRDFEIMEELF